MVVLRCLPGRMGELPHHAWSVTSADDMGSPRVRAHRLRWGQVTPELAQGLMSSSCMSQTGQDPRALVKRGSLPLHSETKQIFPEHLPRARNWANKQQKRRFSGILILFVCLFVCLFWGILILVSIPLSPAQGVGAGKPLCSWLRARGPLSPSCRGFACSQGAWQPLA